jgi:outer membrane protein
MRRKLTVQSRQLKAPPPARVSSKTMKAAAMAGALITFVASVAVAEVVRLTAADAAARAVEASFPVAAENARGRATKEAVNAADAAALPTVSASAAVAQRSSVPDFRLPFALPGQMPPVLVPDVDTTYGSSVRLQETLYGGGAIAGQRAAARHDLDASDAAREQAVADVRLAAQLAYWQAVAAHASVDAAQAQEERARHLLDDTDNLLDAGMAVQADVLAAKERAASAHVAVIRAQAASANLFDQLRSLLRLADGIELDLADSLEGPLPSMPLAADALEPAALAHRPELAAAAARIAALRAREAVAKAPARPSVGLAAEWDYARPNTRYFPPLDEWKQSWSVGLQASWTLFDAGRTRAQVAASRATQEAAARDQDELVRGIRFDVRTRRRDLESALATVEAADAARAAARERERSARERHAAGLAIMTEVLDAETQLAAAEQQEVDARSSCWIAAARLARSVAQ